MSDSVIIYRSPMDQAVNEGIWFMFTNHPYWIIGGCLVFIVCAFAFLMKNERRGY